MAAVKGQPAPKPGSLEAPVPGAEAQDQVSSFLSSFDAPRMPASEPSAMPDPQATPAGTADAFLSQFDPQGGTEMPQEPQRPGAEQFAEEPGFVQANLDQFNPKNFMDRLQAGLAANDREKVMFLQKKYGNENVAERNGKIYYRREKGEKLRPLDPGTLELIADIIPDFGREIVQEGAMLPAEAMGFASGAAMGTAGGPAAPATIPAGAAAGAIAGRVAAVPAANAFADKVAEMAGVPQDPERNLRTENMIGMGAEAVLPVVGGKIVGAIAKKIPGSLAYKAAREAGEKEVVALSKQSKEVLAAADALEKEGLNVGLTLNQVQPDSPKVLELAGKAKDNPEFLNKQMEFAEGYGEALRNTIGEIGRRFNPAGPVPEGQLASKLTNAVETLDRAEGKQIGAYRAQALSALKGQKQQLPAETSDLVTQTMREMGFQPKRVQLQSVTRAGSPGSVERMGALQQANKIERVKWVPPKDANEVAGRLGLKDASEARGLINVLNDYGQYISRGNEARLPDVERLITRLGPLSDRYRGTQAGAVLGKITGDLRTHRREMIKSVLGPEDKVLFDRVMDDFGTLRKSREELTNVLRGDVTRKTIVNSFLTGKDALSRFRALQQITGPESAEIGALKEEMLNQFMIKHAADGKTRVNSGKFLSDLEKNYGRDFINEVFKTKGPGPNMDTVRNLLTVGKRIEEQQIRAGADVTNAQAGKAAADATMGLLANIKFKTLNGVAGLLRLNTGEKKAVGELLNRDGWEKYVVGMKLSGPQKRTLAKNVEELMSIYNSARAAKSKVNDVLDVGKDLMKRGARADIRNRLSVEGEQ